MKRKKQIQIVDEVDDVDGMDEGDFDDFDSGQMPMPPHDPYLSERFNRVMGRYFERNTPRNIEEANRVMQSRFAGRKVDDLVVEARKGDWGDADEAQEIMFDAMASDSQDGLMQGVDKALALDPNNADALLFTSMRHAQDRDDAIRRIRAAITQVEAAFGPEFMEENKGHFWGNVFTRPYMRLRLGLFEILNEEERWDEAIAEAEAMLELNPNDNQGVRDHLLIDYLTVGNAKAARALMKRYPEGHMAVHAWANVFEKHLSNNKEGARKALAAALRCNPHVPKYMFGMKRLPSEFSGYYSPGTESEAVYCMGTLMPLLLAHEKIILWMAETLAKRGTNLH